MAHTADGTKGHGARGHGARGPGGRPGRPPKEEAQDTKALLIDAATRLFARHGYAGTSTRAIAREVGSSESVLYAHFPSKRAIYEAAYAQGGPAAVSAVIEELAERDLSPPDYVRAFAADILTRWDAPRARRLASLTGHDGLLHDPALLDDIERALDRLSAVFATWHRDGLLAEVDGEPRDIAYALLSPIAHARQLWLHDTATDEQRRTGRDRIGRHAELIAGLLDRPSGVAG